MNAASVLARAEAAGVRFVLDAGRVRMTSDRPPPPDVVTDLRQHRDDVAHLLALREAVADPGEHDGAEAVALAAHHAAAAHPHAYKPTDPDPLRDGLLAAAMRRPPAWADNLAEPSRGSVCASCAGRRWWGDRLGWRCATCHPRPRDYRPSGRWREVQT
ncbi:hypothetical protein EAH89_21370 [Roseomonas nepalensis]|uniref:TubC N-terminal docking domain-containing protein n=1 Tax=Muricoccus nepalensis TaxID=1854500 RepID=A0A502FJF7_9PROT|nr:hypothetical protein [Roseomonas nepalensis]TPG49561.1 hypothetical protein EAH89_21370 [Roseomonas nepalensis]